MVPIYARVTMCPIKESIVQFTYNRKTVNKCPRLEMSVHRVDFEVRKRTKSKEDNGTLEIAVRRYIETSGYLKVFSEISQKLPST